MDERLKLTDEQKVIVERLNKTITEVLNKNNIRVIHHSDTNNLYFFNDKDVADWDWPEGVGDYELKVEDCEHFDLNAIALASGDESIRITFNE